MSRIPRRSALVIVALLALTACGSGREGIKACTGIAARAGIGFTIKPEMAAGVTAAELRICTDGNCTEKAIELQPGSVTVDEGCNQDKIDGVCSARIEPDGSLTGFFETTAITDKATEVTLTLIRSGATESYAADVTPARVFPNGPACGGDALQANLELGGNGLLRPADAASSGNS